LPWSRNSINANVTRTAITNPIATRTAALTLPRPSR
jgi:hypothetical protein